MVVETHTNGAQRSGFLRLVGTPVQRVEDQRILRGRGRYMDDMVLPGMVHAAFVRSPHPHARITRVDASAARALSGVVAVFTAEDVERVTNPVGNQPAPGHKSPPIYGLTRDKVRLIGDVVAIVIAESRYLAEDGAELVEVEYEPLQPIATSRTRSTRADRRCSRSLATTSRSTCPRAGATSMARLRRRTVSSSRPFISTATRTCRWRAAAASPTTTRPLASSPITQPTRRRRCSAWCSRTPLACQSSSCA